MRSRVDRYLPVRYMSKVARAENNAPWVFSLHLDLIVFDILRFQRYMFLVCKYA
jgi:hypothetical protein